MRLKALRSKLKTKPAKKFLFLAGGFVLAFFLFVVLHNLFYALAQVTSQWKIINFIFGCFEALFFLIAVFVCPLGFLVATIGALISYRKKR